MPIPAPLWRSTRRVAPRLPGADLAAGSTCCLKLAIAASSLSGGVWTRVPRMNIVSLLPCTRRSGPPRIVGPHYAGGFVSQGSGRSRLVTLGHGAEHAPAAVLRISAFDGRRLVERPRQKAALRCRPADRGSQRTVWLPRQARTRTVRASLAAQAGSGL